MRANHPFCLIVLWAILWLYLSSLMVTQTGPEHLNDNMISPPTKETWLEFLEKARRKALQYSEELPDFTCLQSTKRHRKGGGSNVFTTNPHSLEWIPVDQYVDELVYVNHREEYKRLELEKGSGYTGFAGPMLGASTAGEFGSTLNALFDSSTRADFKMEGTAKIEGRKAIKAKFKVSRENSKLDLKWQRDFNPLRSHAVGYQGYCWIDLETLQTVRLELETLDVAPDFPISKASWIIAYKLWDIAGRQNWLPASAEFHQWTAGSRELPAEAQFCEFRNIMKFDHYRKYETEVNIVP